MAIRREIPYTVRRMETSQHTRALRGSALNDAAALAAHARAVLPLTRMARSMPPRARGDFDLNAGFAAPVALPLRPAAVLIAIVARDPLTVILTQRTQTLSSHPGQIAFPGGRIDAPDETPTAAALREAHEEIGLSSHLIEPLGFLDTYTTATGYAIEPLVSMVAPGFALALQAGEVAEVFEVPLAFLMDEANHRIDTKIWQGVERRFYAMPFQNRYIWGATAGILKNMHERLFAP